MNIEETREGNVVVLAPAGRLDAATSPLLQERALAMPDKVETPLLIDLAETDYMSSAGMRALLVGTKEYRRSEGRFVLCGLKPEVRHIMETSGMHTMFPIFDDRASALAAMCGPSC